GGLPKTFGGPGIYSLWVRGVLHENASAARRERHPLNFMELFTRVHASVDAGARACIHVRRALRIDDDREDIGIVDDALVHVCPGFTAVGGLPGKMPGPGVNNIRIQRVDGYGLKILQIRVMVGSDLLPAIATIRRAINA